MPTYDADCAGQILLNPIPLLGAAGDWLQNNPLGPPGRVSGIPDPPAGFSHSGIQFGPLNPDIWITSCIVRLTLDATFGGLFEFNCTGTLELDLYLNPQGDLLPRVDGPIAPGFLDISTLRSPPDLRTVVSRLPLDPPNMTQGTVLDFTLDSIGLSLVNSVITHPNWNRYLIFQARTANYASVGVPFFQIPPTYTGQYADAAVDPAGPDLITEEIAYEDIGAIRGNSGPETGRPWKDGGHDGVSRLDRCPRCGNLSLRSRWVRDGFAHGLRVCQDCYDPTRPEDIERPDPPERTPLRNEDN